MKSKYMIFLIILLNIILRAGMEETCKMIKLDQNGPLLVTANRKVVYDEIYELSSANMLFEEFCTLLDIEYYKQTSGIKYTAVDTDNGSVLAIFSDDDKLIYFKVIRYSSDDDEKKISGLENGTCLTDIMKADPGGDYSFLLASWSGYPQFSFHYFVNGDCYIFHYENGKLDESVFITL